MSAVDAPSSALPNGGEAISTARPTDLQELRHEVANALAVASGYAQRLLRHCPVGAAESDRVALQAIRESVDRAMRLLDSATAAAVATGSDLRVLVARATLEIPTQRQDDLDVRVLASGPLTGKWDDERVVEVIVNLLLNAAKYSARHTRIVVVLSRFGPVAQVVVRDRGIGIAAGEQDAVFKGYRTGPARQMAEGSGIGLGLSRRLAEEQGGRLWVTSVPHVGSDFYFALPLTPATSPAA